MNFAYLSLLLIFILSPPCLYAIEGTVHETHISTDFAYYFDSNYGYGQDGGFVTPDYTPAEDPSGSGETLGSGWGGVELQASLNHNISIPFLQGKHSLTQDNAIGFNFNLNVNPVSVDLSSSVSITPLAFLTFTLGGSLGTGWNIKIFNGLGLNTTGSPEEESFPGVVSSLWTSATFQFDLAALIPGKWTHVVFSATSTLDYKNFSGAEDNDPWQWQADSGMNYNGFSYYNSFFLGYQMPLILDTIGFLLETAQNLGSTRKISTIQSGGWGSDFISMSFGPVANLSFNNHHSLTILLQFSNGIDYTDNTIFNKNFIYKKYQDSYIAMNRIALSYSYKF